MPVNDDNVLGFSNPWYPEGFAQAIPYSLPDKMVIQLMPAVYFVATKLAALRSRGMRDIRLSSDLEDIIYLIDNRVSFVVEVAQAATGVRAYPATEVRQLLLHPEIREAIDCQLPYGSGSERKYVIERRLTEIIAATGY